ncbi:hypothetical protein BDZ91DRAFT_288448 [Kalaharituber pfeilii]|nr:hypothetical protein BDZ91DRAFT_288448 [Kalaharituber pfeilii]
MFTRVLPSSDKEHRSLRMFMKETFGSESGLNGHGKHQLGHAAIVDANRHPSPTSYQYSQSAVKQPSMSIPRVPLSLNNMSLTNESPTVINDMDNHSTTLALPSPISPRSTRCPSLAGSIFTSATCPSPSGSGPTTPTSEHGGQPHAYTARSSAHLGRLYDHRDSLYQARSNSPATAHRVKHHTVMHTTSLHIGIPSGRLVNSMDPDILMPEHQGERITKQEKRRRNHLESEKRRRNHIKSGMDALVDLVPSCRNIQESKANILKNTKEYIFQLLNALKKAQSEAERLGQENRELRKLLAMQGPPQLQIQPENVVYRARP